MTAAHPTLPMPVMVQVTNLENGRSIKVRINDRGPFANGRIIDLSKRAAQLLDMERNGTAKVLVEILPDESQQLVSIAQRHTPVTDDQDVPEAAPVGTVEATPLGASPGGGGTAAQPTPPVSPSVAPPATNVATAAVPVADGDGDAEKRAADADLHPGRQPSPIRAMPRPCGRNWPPSARPSSRRFASTPRTSIVCGSGRWPASRKPTAC